MRGEGVGVGGSIVDSPAPGGSVGGQVCGAVSFAHGQGGLGGGAVAAAAGGCRVGRAGAVRAGSGGWGGRGGGRRVDQSAAARRGPPRSVCRRCEAAGMAVMGPSPIGYRGRPYARREAGWSVWATAEVSTRPGRGPPPPAAGRHRRQRRRSRQVGPGHCSRRGGLRTRNRSREAEGADTAAAMTHGGADGLNAVAGAPHHGHRTPPHGSSVGRGRARRTRSVSGWRQWTPSVGSCCGRRRCTGGGGDDCGGGQTAEDGRNRLGRPRGGGGRASFPPLSSWAPSAQRWWACADATGRLWKRCYGRCLAAGAGEWGPPRREQPGGAASSGAATSSLFVGLTWQARRPPLSPLPTPRRRRRPRPRPRPPERLVRTPRER